MIRILGLSAICLFLSCLNNSKLTGHVSQNMTFESCDTFKKSLPLDFADDWRKDSIGDLGLRNKYISFLDSELVGLSFDCIQENLGPSNHSFGNEHIYYCGIGKGSSEQLWFKVENGLVIGISFVLE